MAQAFKYKRCMYLLYLSLCRRCLIITRDEHKREIANSRTKPETSCWLNLDSFAVNAGEITIMYIYIVHMNGGYSRGEGANAPPTPFKETLPVVPCAASTVHA